MTDETNDRPGDDGFELDGTFYRWHLSDQGKDLMLIDRFTGMPVTDFFELVEDSFDRGRAPVLLAMLATSIRHKHPSWTVERIYRLVSDTALSDVKFIDADREADPRPPDGAASPAAETSTTPSDDSSSSSTLEETSPTYAMSSGTPE